MFKNTPVFSSFSVDDLAKAKAFYGDTLGLEVVETDQGLEIKCAGGVRISLYPKNDHIPATFTILNFVVPDIESAVDELKEKEVEVERYYDIMGVSADEKGILRGKAEGMGPDITWIKDPANNVIGILEE